MDFEGHLSSQYLHLGYVLGTYVRIYRVNNSKIGAQFKIGTNIRRAKVPFVTLLFGAHAGGKVTPHLNVVYVVFARIPHGGPARIMRAPRRLAAALQCCIKCLISYEP